MLKPQNHHFFPTKPSISSNSLKKKKSCPPTSLEEKKILISEAHQIQQCCRWSCSISHGPHTCRFSCSSSWNVRFHRCSKTGRKLEKKHPGHRLVIPSNSLLRKKKVPKALEDTRGKVWYEQLFPASEISSGLINGAEKTNVESKPSFLCGLEILRG